MCLLNVAGVVAVFCAPIFFNLEAENQGAFFHSNRIVVPGGGLQFARQAYVDFITGLPVAFDGIIFAGNNAFLFLSIDRNFRSFAPFRDAQF